MTAFQLPAAPAAIFFDLDGTLVDSEREVQEVIAEVLLAHGRPLSPDERDFIVGHAWGDIDRKLRAGAAVPLTLPELEQAVLLRRLDRARLHGVGALPGAEAAVQRAATRAPLCLVTGSSRAEAEMCLAALGLRARFVALVCAEDYPRGKPAPDPFLRAAAHLQVAPAACLVIEDSTAGIAAAHAAGMPCVAVRAGNFARQDQSAADLLLDTLDELRW